MSLKREKKETNTKRNSFGTLPDLGPQLLSVPGSPPLDKKKNPSWRVFRKGHKRGVSEGNVILTSEPISLEPRKRRSDSLNAANLESSPSKNPPASSMLVLNPIMEGFIHVKWKKGWKHRFMVLDANNIFIFKSPEDTGIPKQIPLMLTQTKLSPSKKNKFRFLVITRNESVKFQTKTENEQIQWVNGIQEVCNSLTIGSIGTNKIDPKELAKDLFDIMKLPGNSTCSDCSEKDPEWASINLGVFICIQCSGLHRNLGTHISKVKSVTLDDWEEEQVRIMKVIGNVRANKIWEASVPPSFEKPQPTSPMSLKQEWIQAKYELGLFKKSNQIDPEDDDDEEKGEEFEWMEAVAPDGRKYYWNKKTKERRWKKPETNSLDLPERWKEATAPDGRKYYYNIITKQRTWKKPTRDSLATMDEKDFHFSNGPQIVIHEIDNLEKGVSVLELEK